MMSPVVGPCYMHLRSKVSHPTVLKIMGETLAKNLNCVIVDERDKGCNVVRQCFMRAMFSNRPAPRWISKDFDIGWLADYDDPLLEDKKQTCKSVDESQDTVENSISETKRKEDGLMSVFNDLVSMLTSIFGYLFKSSVGYVKSLKYFTKNNLENDPNEEGTSGENTVDCPVKPMSLYSHNLVKAHEKFPTVLELLDCDSPWIKQMLVHDQGLDKILVVPKFEECTSLLDSLDRDFTIAGKFDNLKNIGK